jgi:hypothetical protein
MKAVITRAAIGVPPRAPSQEPVVQQGLISMARHTTSPANVEQRR